MLTLSRNSSTLEDECNRSRTPLKCSSETTLPSSCKVYQDWRILAMENTAISHLVSLSCSSSRTRWLLIHVSVLFPRHLTPQRRYDSISHIQTFRDYFHYHIKASKVSRSVMPSRFVWLTSTGLHPHSYAKAYRWFPPRYVSVHSISFDCH